MQAASELYPEIPIVMHQDHGNSPDTCISAIRMGFTSVMMDGSLEGDGKTPASYEYNVAVTREWSTSRTASAFRSRVSSAVSARSRAAPARKKTATVPRAS